MGMGFRDSRGLGVFKVSWALWAACTLFWRCTFHGLEHYQGAVVQALSRLVRRVVVRTLWQYLTGRMCQNSTGIQGPTKGSSKSLQNSASALRRAHASQRP